MKPNPVKYRSSASTLDPTPWIVTIAVVLLIGAIYIASSVLVPIVISLLAYLTLRPVEVRLRRFGINQTVAAGLLIIAFFSIVGVISALLYQPLQTWLGRAPHSMTRLQENFEHVAAPLTMIDRAENQLGEASEEVSENFDGEIGAEDSSIEVSVQKPGIIDRAYLINTTGHVLTFVAAIAVLTFFMLASGDSLLNRILNVIPDPEHRKEVLSTIGDIQDNVGRYLSQITCINFCMGTVAGIVMWLVGMPTPILWGTMAALMNYIPFLGPVGGTLIVLFAASSVFESIGQAVGVALAFYLVTAIEGQFVTPAILGKTLKVGSLVVLIAVAFWGFLWGFAGIFLAVPLLIVLRQIFASFDATFPLAVILGENACATDEGCDPVPDDEPIADLA